MWGFAYIREGRRREEREKRIWSMNETEKQAENEQMEAIVTGQRNSNVSLFSTDICQSVESTLFPFALGNTVFVFLLVENNTVTSSHLEAATFTHSLICWPLQWPALPFTFQIQIYLGIEPLILQ